MTAILYKTTGEKVPVTPQDGKIFSLKELQAFVGGYIQMLPVPGTNRMMVINEEGKLEGLPDNLLATALMQSVLRPGDFIVGDVVTCEFRQLDRGDDV
jgi:hypothetical protein